MAEFAVYFLIEKLTVLSIEKVKLFKGVRTDFEFVRDELERMTAFLRVADSFEESDPELKVWVKQVREMAYDTEDVIDEFLLRSTHDHGRHGIHGFLGELYFSIKKFKSTRKVASEIRSIISRLRNIAEGHQRYHYKLSIQEQGSSSSFVDYSVTDGRGDALLLEEGELVGIDHHKQSLIRLLMKEDPRLKLISVVGMGGLGKTTLVKRVFDDSVVKKHFQSHAWLTVSQLFKIEDLLKDTIQQLFDEIKQPLPEGIGSMNSNRLKEIIREFLRGRRYVLVFDDVWSIPAWEAIKYALPKENHGSRIILTTRLINVASSSCIETDGFVYELKPLSEEESWTLFCRKTFQGNSCPHHLIEICSNILRHCGGLPLAIVAIGGLLATKNTSRVGEWEMLNHSLQPELEDNDELESMKNILLLSFNDLPYYLKPCFLYLSIYPEDHLIEHNTLIRLWITEGFVKQKEGRTVEEVAEGYLNELINRSLIFMVKTNDDRSLKYGQIHDLYREVILSKAREQNFVTTASEQKMMWPSRVRRLSIHNALEHAKKGTYGTRVRSLLTFGVTDLQSMLNILQLLSSFRMLKVLSLKDVPLMTVPKAIFTMFHLRHLSLRNTKVKVLPGSIKKLKKLETLDLKQTYITELPVEILELHRLSHLLLYRHVVYSYLPYDCTDGFKAIKGIGGLISLRKLGYMEASCGSDTIKEISMMTELRRLCLTKLRREDGMAICSSIEKLHNLRSLNLKSTGENEVLDLQYLSSPPPFLQRLYLTGCIEKFPIWIRSLQNLIKVYFRWSKLRDDPLQYLQDLPNLVHLEFLVGFTGEELCFKAGKFQRLKLLDFDKLEPLRRVIVEKGAMPHLEKLVIQRCNLLERIPQGIEHLIELKVVEFFDMPDEFIMTMDPRRLGDDYCKVAHIPEVYYTFWRDGGWEIYSLEQNPADVIRTQGRRNSL
ncbi:disease resistance RPM1-like [Olea europaea subsp. europaea]|uniref:Disease resistance RPM1-like n=1 Tax=Olea europaea subsp. europaea TaxID=158383 RepID=A0A8S0RBU4_OLEEU|nr:disease resistance RPM1-like [Olea europaea subsp. europaea]